MRGTKVNHPVRIKGIHRRNMFSFVAEFAIRAVFHDKEIMFLSQRNQHLPFLQGQGLSGRILEIRNHIEELNSLSLSLDLLQDRFIGLSEGFKVIVVGNASDVRPV